MRTLISLILNIIWLLTAGWSLFLGYVVAGILACIFIVTIPFGLASFRIAGFVIWPFGREVVDTGRGGAVGAIGNVIWFEIGRASCRESVQVVEFTVHRISVV